MVFALYFIPMNTAYDFQPKGQDNGSTALSAKSLS